MHCLYAAPGSGHCYKPLLLMHQMGIPHRIEWIDVMRGENRQPPYLTLNPAGTVPFLELSCGGRVTESNAMLWALATRSDLMPRDGLATAHAVQWMIFEQTRLAPFLAPARMYTTQLPHMTGTRAFEIDEWRAKAESGLAFVERHLTGSAFMLGEGYSIADIALYAHLHLIAEAGIDPDRFPEIQHWCAEIAALPGHLPLEAMDRAA